MKLGGRKFSLYPLHELSLRQRLIRSLLTFGLVMALWEIIFPDSPSDWLGTLLIALFVGITSGIGYGLTEHALAKIIKGQSRKE